MTEYPMRYVYRIDAADTITFVNPEWLKFAKENEAPELTEKAVIGKTIWHFIIGVETRILYENLFESLRSRRSEIIIPFRCDSPTIIRDMSLTLRSLLAGGIECEGRLLHLETREFVAILSRWASRSDKSIPVCSLCRRLLIQEEWIEVSAAIVRMRLFSVVPVPRLEETVCPECRSKIA